MHGEKRKSINRNHPNCAEYSARFHAIWDAYFKLEDKEKAKYPDWQGKDHPANAVLRPIHKKCCAETRALQEEYAYLFTEDIPDNEDDL